MTYTDETGEKFPVRVLASNGPYRYIELPDGSTINVHWSALSDAGTAKKVPRYIPNPEPYRTPSKRGAKP